MEWFLANPDVAPPAELQALLDAYDATNLGPVDEFCTPCRHSPRLASGSTSTAAPPASATVDASPQPQETAREGRPEAKPTKGGRKTDNQSRGMKRPDDKAFKAYQAFKVAGGKQADIARQMHVDQSTISRWVRHVDEWLERGNVLTDEMAAVVNAKPPKPTCMAMEPRVLEQGPKLNKRRA